MHNIPLELILDEAKRILQTDRIRPVLRQLSLDNGSHNFELLYVISANGLFQAEDGLCNLKMFFKNNAVYFLDNNVSGVLGDYIPFTVQPNLFIDNVEIVNHPYFYTLLAYVFEKY